ncbi:HemK2/MTQ2 family protein methyltransferase [Streptomyces sp. SP18CS02]|uniref:HemK2/MTQ2 family protein methyltransferase n=1 Tax=Streptomyces sp. SP18CS02 TaxID=3002531 RepID=UPI002E787D39|nr:HemK2/MTQ2 family protein methyltransferase [Streptomyces sp. SP18CS02]MEE1752825.1 methyltransferase [Streptomyces sp. SP18CS02]
MTTAAARPADLGKLWTLPGVYTPQADTHLLAQALEAERITEDMDVLDICTGSGALALLAARRGARVSATDISWRAVMTARLNAARAGQRVQVWRGDLTGPVAQQRFDLVVSNPPYVPTPHAHRARRHRAEIAWNAGHGGRRAVDRICAFARDVLRPRGVLLMVHSGLCGAEETLGKLTDAGLHCTVADRSSVPFGPVMTARLPWLRAQGLIGADEDEEELVVIRAERG